ncbi:MAG: hypothetical protein GY821_13900 [Gammaproteobacteria bacterium]|nr:hypothetical protein [Gammaproteobacteria bacterium]
MIKLTFIIGASGSGKTAILQALKQRLANAVAVYDFDEIGVPNTPDKRWRQQATEQWLQQLIANGKDACLLGQMVLGEILACPTAKQLKRIYLCLLDVSDRERVRRLTLSNASNCHQDTLNWAAWLRLHHQDPQWAPQVIKDDSWQALDFSCWRSLTDWKTVATIKVLDTTSLSIESVAINMENFIHHQNDQPHVIFLNGSSSSGKTTLAKQLQQKLESYPLQIHLQPPFNCALQMIHL